MLLYSFTVSSSQSELCVNIIVYLCDRTIKTANSPKDERSLHMNSMRQEHTITSTILHRIGHDLQCTLNLSPTKKGQENSRNGTTIMTHKHEVRTRASRSNPTHYSSIS